MQIAIRDFAWLSVVNSIGIAEIEAISRAEPPNCVLNKPRESGRKLRVEGACINQLRNGPDNLGAATGGVTGRAVAVRSATTRLDSGAVEEVVHQGVNGNHGFPGLEPNRPMAARPDQQAGQRHGEYLVGYAEY